MPDANARHADAPCKIAIIWIDWYAYHVARIRGLMEHPSLAGRVRGVELVGGIGVHSGLRFREELPADLPVETLLPESSWRDAGQFPLARRLWQALTRIDPEAVFVPGYYTLPGLAAALWAMIHRRTSILMTESTASDHRRVWWKEACKGALIRTLFDGAICGGIAHRRYLDQLGFPTDRIASSYDVVDNDFFANRANTLRRQNTPPAELARNYFLYVGRLSPEKNIEGLLQSWMEYRSLGGRWPLVIVGAGPSQDALRRQAAASPWVQDVYFAGQKSYQELPLFYAFAGCFVLPSTREPWGLVVNEAMASGLPIIVSSHCGCSESLIDLGQNGLIVSSAISLTKSLLTISNLTNDQRQAWGNHSRSIVRNYSPATFGEQASDLLKICRI